MRIAKAAQLRKIVDANDAIDVGLNMPRHQAHLPGCQAPAAIYYTRRGVTVRRATLILHGLAAFTHGKFGQSHPRAYIFNAQCGTKGVYPLRDEHQELSYGLRILSLDATMMPNRF
jgi:hypothetical protein